MRQLHAADFLRLDAGGAISAAYPFSPAPTPHLVTISGGPQVYAMCAIDALGIAAMLGKTVTISSSEPGTGAPVTVTVPAAGGAAVWEPGTAVVFYGQRDGLRNLPAGPARWCCRPPRTPAGPSTSSPPKPAPPPGPGPIRWRGNC